MTSSEWGRTGQIAVPKFHRGAIAKTNNPSPISPSHFCSLLALFRQGIHRYPRHPSSNPLSSLAYFDRQWLPRPPEKLLPGKRLSRLPELRPPGRHRGKSSFRLLVASAKGPITRETGIWPFTEVCFSSIVFPIRQMSFVFQIFSHPPQNPIPPEMTVSRV